MTHLFICVRLADYSISGVFTVPPNSHIMTQYGGRADTSLLPVCHFLTESTRWMFPMWQKWCFPHCLTAGRSYFSCQFGAKPERSAVILNPGAITAGYISIWNKSLLIVRPISYLKSKSFLWAAYRLRHSQHFCEFARMRRFVALPAAWRSAFPRLRGVLPISDSRMFP